MLKNRVMLALAFLPVFAGIASAQTLPTEIKVATEGAYPPWNYTNADGSLTGYEIDLTHALCDRMKVKCTIVSQEWNGIIPGLTVGKYDAIIASMGVTPARKKVIAFSKSYAKAPNGFLTTSDNDLKSLAEARHAYDLTDSPADAQSAINELKTKFKGKVIGVQTGSTASNFAREYFKGLDIRDYPTFEQLALDLANGRLDIGIANVTTFKPVIEANKGALVSTGPTFAGGVLGQGTTNIALRQGDEALRQAFDAAITSVNSDGTNKALAEKWFGVDISTRD
ncbi:amino acid ABC transporter substrate-binding protein, PAAT family (TC 3.A.1.3.-) [Pseudomonas sp. URIL14HWK12:I9]|nr:octopine/nopaline transport system substrate-binding protein [Pseudomonas sp. URIL14HWK12:I12]PVZ21085.1 octopine/nopaline transport system substrate-binding protein [Pseudomonas sp. URIL14HWK12:I10]PVZ29670.1 octopine/nopaline transport system substrate-binding protein [Pseudomonas sp. URIL14HWK12:I11]SNZ18911.1 amino acid ABC transporter substrate-binding protein, PAAT family (TC 3.A.1.3.-) [Pseudomonas sp. URIL14HWK12:I9]